MFGEWIDWRDKAMRKIKHKLFTITVSAKPLLVGLLLVIGSITSAFSQEADVLPIPENYKIEGIPVIKNSEVKDLFYDPSAIKSNLIWDTDTKNRRLLVTDQKNSVYLLDTPMAQPAHIIEKIVPGSVKTRPDGSLLAYTADQETEDSYQLYLYDFKEKSSKKLTNLTSKEQSVDSFIWSKKGDLVFFVKVDYESKTTKLCQTDLLTEKCYQIKLGGIWEVADSFENKILLRYWKASSSQYLYLFDLQTEKLTPLDEKGNCRRAFLTSERAFWTSDGNDECKKQPCILSVDYKRNVRSQLKLPADLVNLNEVRVSPQGTNLMIQDNKNGIDVLRIFRLNKDKISKEIPQFISGSFVIWNTRWLSDNEIAYTLENIGKPASIQSFDLNTKKITDWTKERLPPQFENKVKAPESISWKSFDQKEISAYVVRPITTAKKTPVLIYVHGGPQIVDKPIFNSMDLRFISTLGITIIHTNIRGSSGFGKDFMDSDNQEKRGDAIKDMQSLLDWIEKQPDLDASQIYLRGGSYGGFIVLSTALQEPSRIKGVIAEYPLVSIRGYLAQSWIDEFAKNEYGDPVNENLMKKLDVLSPLNNTDRWNQIPLFLTRGKLDTRSSEKDVIDLKNQLQSKKSEVWFVYSTDDGHGFGSNYLTAAMYKFLKKQIKMEK
jgi:dipeptidyl aminopeptidase/acylaminoacyl peptidase